MQALLAPPRQDLTEEEVLDALDLDRGPIVRHGVDVLTETETQTDEELHVEKGEVRWSYRPPDRVTGQTTDVTAVRRQASLTIACPTTVPLALRRFRPWTEWLSSSGTWVRFWFGIYVPTLPPLADDGIVRRSELALADKTKLYADDTLDEPLTIPAATNLIDWLIDDLTDQFDETAFSITESAVTNTRALTFAAGTSRLEVYNAVLKAAAYDQLTTDESGRPTATPHADIVNRGPAAAYGPGEGKILTAGQVEPLLPTLPNVVRFVARQGPTLPTEGNGIRTVRNQDTGPASIDQRGREITMRVVVEAEAQDELDAIAEADAQRYFAGGGQRYQGRIGLNPRLSDRDILTLTKPRLELDAAAWNVTDWAYPLLEIRAEDAMTMPITLERNVTVELEGEGGS